MSTKETIIEEAARVLFTPSEWKEYNRSLLPGFGFLEELVVAITVIYLSADNAKRGVLSWNQVGTLDHWQQFSTQVESHIPLYEQTEGWNEGINCNHGVEQWKKFSPLITNYLLARSAS